MKLPTNELYNEVLLLSRIEKNTNILYHLLWTEVIRMTLDIISLIYGFKRKCLLFKWHPYIVDIGYDENEV